MDFTKTINRFKLLIPTRTFADRITQSGQTTGSPLHSRLVFSWLAYRSRKTSVRPTEPSAENLDFTPKP